MVLFIFTNFLYLGKMSSAEDGRPENEGSAFLINSCFGGDYIVPQDNISPCQLYNRGQAIISGDG